MSAPTEPRLGAGRFATQVHRPEARTTVHELTTFDRARTTGVLATVPGARTVVSIMHPRQDATHHPLVPALLRMGVAVWTQGARSVNNDIALIHEQALLDVAAGIAFLREQGFESIVTLGHSGGGALYAYYAEQAGLPAEARLTTTPGGRPTHFAEAALQPPDGVIFLAPHPGPGRLLENCIDPSVADESDPLSVRPELDAFDSRNGFAEPMASARYSEAFLARYRQAQRERVARIDARARDYLAEAARARARYATGKVARDKRRSIAPRILTVYRTDADPRTVDLSLDPSERPYGSVFGHRPDLTNYGLVGFGRFSTPEAWLSTWSGRSSRADFLRCAPQISFPTLFIEFTGDQAAFPEESRRMSQALGAADRTALAVRGTHFGGPIAPGEPAGNELAGRAIRAWLEARYPLAPPA